MAATLCGDLTRFMPAFADFESADDGSNPGYDEAYGPQEEGGFAPFNEVGCFGVRYSAEDFLADDEPGEGEADDEFDEDEVGDAYDEDEADDWAERIVLEELDQHADADMYDDSHPDEPDEGARPNFVGGPLEKKNSVNRTLRQDKMNQRAANAKLHSRTRPKRKTIRRNFRPV